MGERCAHSCAPRQPHGPPPALQPRPPCLLRALPYNLIIGFHIDGFLVSGSAPAPYVCSVKGVIAEELRHERGGVRHMLWSLARLERRNARRAPLVLTTSTYCRRQIDAHYGVPARRCGRPRRSPRRAPGAPSPQMPQISGPSLGRSICGICVICG